jgi:hypothetical protein
MPRGRRPFSCKAERNVSWNGMFRSCAHLGPSDDLPLLARTLSDLENKTRQKILSTSRNSHTNENTTNDISARLRNREDMEAGSHGSALAVLGRPVLAKRDCAEKSGLGFGSERFHADAASSASSISPWPLHARIQEQRTSRSSLGYRCIAVQATPNPIDLSKSCVLSAIHARSTIRPQHQHPRRAGD